MTWAALASNQHTPTGDVEDGISTGVLAWKDGIVPTTPPVANLYWTRETVQEYLAVGTISGIATNEHMTKSQIEAVAILPPDATTLSLVSVASQTVNLSWTAVIDALDYVIFRSTTDKGTPAPADEIDDTTSTTYQDTGLTNNTLYYYWVTARNQAGQGDVSNRISATPVAPAPAPTDFSGLGLTDEPSVGEYTAQLQWSNAGREETKILEVFNRVSSTWQNVTSSIGASDTTYDHIFGSALYAEVADMNGEVDYRIKFTTGSEFATTTVIFFL